LRNPTWYTASATTTAANIQNMGDLHTVSLEHAPVRDCTVKGNRSHFRCENAPLSRRRLAAYHKPASVCCSSPEAPGCVLTVGGSQESTRTAYLHSTWSDVLQPDIGRSPRYRASINPGNAAPLRPGPATVPLRSEVTGTRSRSFWLCQTTLLWELKSCRGAGFEEGDGLLSLEACPQGRMPSKVEAVPMNRRSGRGKGGVLSA
jgi:hypothetical protein